MHAEFTSETIFPLVNEDAPCCLTVGSIKPQLVTPSTMLCEAYDPKLVPESKGGIPKFASQGPPLDPPVCSEPIIVLFEKVVLMLSLIHI